MGVPIRNWKSKLTQNYYYWENRDISEKNIQKAILTCFNIIIITMLFDAIRGYFLILLFPRTQTTASEGLLMKKAIKCEVDLLETPNLYRICLIIFFTHPWLSKLDRCLPWLLQVFQTKFSKIHSFNIFTWNFKTFIHFQFLS